MNIFHSAFAVGTEHTRVRATKWQLQLRQMRRRILLFFFFLLNFHVPTWIKRTNENECVKSVRVRIQWLITADFSFLKIKIKILFEGKISVCARARNRWTRKMLQTTKRRYYLFANDSRQFNIYLFSLPFSPLTDLRWCDGAKLLVACTHCELRNHRP